jgi:hypothetical protein
MASEWDEKFSAIVNELENLKLVFIQAKTEGLDTSAIEQKNLDLIGQLSDEQLFAYREYAEERERQADARVKLLRESLAEAEAELQRRKRGGKR